MREQGPDTKRMSEDEWTDLKKRALCSPVLFLAMVAMEANRARAAETALRRSPREYTAGDIVDVVVAIEEAVSAMPGVDIPKTRRVIRAALTMATGITMQDRLLESVGGEKA